MQEVRLQVIIDDIKANTKLSALQVQLDKLKQLGETGIKLHFDEKGNLTQVFSQLKDASGAVVNYVRNWNAEAGKLDEKSASVAYNYEKIEKNNAKIEAEAKRLLAQEDELARKTAERARKEQEIAEARERQSAHNQRQRDLELTFANYDDYIKSLNLTEEQLEKMGLASDNAKEKTAQLGNQAQKTGGQFTLLNTIFLRLAHTLLSTVIRSFREAITEMKNVDTQLTVISRVTQTSLSDLENLKNKAYEVGSAYGVMASDYLSAAAAFSRAGYREQAEDLAELSSKLQIAGGVSADVANQFLIATDKAYQLNGSVTELSEVMDKLTVIDHNYATSVEKIADGMGIVAPVAAQAHMSTDELIASLGTITAVTQRSGTEAARALRALILSIIKDTTTEIDEGVTWTIEEINSLQDALKLYAPEVVKAAQATGQLIDPMEAIAALAKSYEDGLLTEAKLADLTSKLGGKLRASQLLSLIQNYSGMYTDMLNQMQSATGAVDKDIEKSLESWEVKIKQLKNTFTEFVEKSLSSDFFKGMLDAVKWLIEGFGDLGTVVAVFGSAIVALNITKIIGLFKNFGEIVTAAGGGFKGLIVTLANYNTLSKAGAVGTESFNTALEGTSVAASSAQAAIGLLVAIISILIIAVNKYKQGLQDSINDAIKADETIAQIKELRKSYDDLQKALEDGEDVTDSYKKAQDELIEKLKDEGVWVDEITGKYDNLEDKINAAADALTALKIVEIEEGIRSAETIVKNTYAGSGYAPTAEVGRIFGSISDAQFVAYASGRQVLDLKELVNLYDKAIARQAELIAQGHTNSDEYNKLKAFTNLFSDSIAEYKRLYAELEKYTSDAIDGTEDFVSVTEDETDAVRSLSDELKEATDALDKYKKALQGGEKGDALKSYSEAYKKAVEMYEKGLTGSNQYMSAIDLLFGDVKDYEEAGKLLGNSFVKAMFEGGGDDYGANAANYIRKHLDEFEGVAISEAEDGTFGLTVTDMDAFAESTGLSADALWTLVDALDIFNSKTTYTRDQLFDLIGLVDDGSAKYINLTAMINDLAGQGKSAREIKDIVEAVKELAETDGNITITEPENLEQTIKDVVELNQEAEKDKDMDVVLTSNSEEFFDGIKKEIDQINGTTLYIGIRTKFSGWGLNEGLGSNAVGTRNARGGLSLVNEEGAELIYANGKAWIAGGGDPTITNLPAGAGVFNAQQTKDILTRSGIQSNANTNAVMMADGGGGKSGASVGGIPEQTSDGGKTGGKKPPQSLSSILKELSEYIDKILKKAKEALQEQLDAIDEQIDKLKREHDAEEDANKLEELRLKILEAEKRLAEAQQERTVRYFNKETGQWEWMADQKAVAEAQKALEDAQKAYDDEVAEQEYQAQLQALQDQKDALNAAYDDLSDRWNKILEALQESENGSGTTDVAKLLASLGKIAGNSTSSDIQKILEELAQFTSNPTSVLDAETTARIMSAQGSTARGGASVLSAMLGSSAYDLNAKGTSNFSTSTSSVIGYNYYINGIQIGSDMMDKPLSQILSVLPIYAN